MRIETSMTLSVSKGWPKRIPQQPPPQPAKKSQDITEKGRAGAEKGGDNKWSWRDQRGPVKMSILGVDDKNLTYVLNCLCCKLLRKRTWNDKNSAIGTKENAKNKSQCKDKGEVSMDNVWEQALLQYSGSSTVQVTSPKQVGQVPLAWVICTTYMT